jgi:outer membrane protein OmpA-like peptidoglycan-associated protein
MARRMLTIAALVAILGGGAFTLERCTREAPAPSHASSSSVDAVVELNDGSTMFAARGTVGRTLIDWLADRKPGQRDFELGGQEFVGQTARLTGESIGRVQRFIAMLRANPEVKVTVVGHTDRSGDPEADLAMSMARAQTVVRLLEKGNISAARLQAQAHGGTEPLASNATEAGRQKNRRVSLILSRKGK